MSYLAAMGKRPAKTVAAVATAPAETELVTTSPALLTNVAETPLSQPQTDTFKTDNNKPFAVVSGATQGIGRAIAERLLREGFDIATCARSEADLQKTALDWAQLFPAAGVLTIAADLSNSEGVRTFSTAILASNRRIDLLVNNTGAYQTGMMASEPEGVLENMMQTNVYSAYHLTRALLPAMLTRRSGHVFNICSIASIKPYANGGAYSISKYALLGFSENLREELKPHGIKVTALCPGATWSRSWDGSGVSPERIMKPDDVAAMLFAAYTLSAQANVELIVMRPLAGDL